MSNTQEVAFLFWKIGYMETHKLNYFFGVKV